MDFSKLDTVYKHGFYGHGLVYLSQKHMILMFGGYNNTHISNLDRICCYIIMIVIAEN